MISPMQVRTPRFARGNRLSRRPASRVHSRRERLHIDAPTRVSQRPVRHDSVGPAIASGGAAGLFVPRPARAAVPALRLFAALLVALNLLPAIWSAQPQSGRPHLTPPTLVSAATPAIDVDHEHAPAVKLDRPPQATVRPPDSPGDTVADAAGVTTLILTA